MEISMKLKFAEIPDPKEPMAVINYAREHNYAVREYMIEEEFPFFGKTVQKLLITLREKGCVEFCFKEIRQDYNISLDAIKWRAVVFGFTDCDKL